MVLKNKIKNSLLYIFFEGLSKGGNTLIFLIAASLLAKNEYVNLLSLFSLEGLFIIISPFYYTDVLFKLRDKYSFKDINRLSSKLIFFYCIILALIIAVFSSFIFKMYGFDSYITLFSIIFIVGARLIFQVQSVNFQIDENHKRAVRLKAIPFLASFFVGLVGFLLFENKIAGFFIGRSLGFLLISVKSIYAFFLNFNFEIDTNFIKDFLKRASNLIIIGLGGWFLGYGMLNILKYYYNDDVNYQIGLMLNMWSLFLLLANGINGVYFPEFRKKYNINIKSADKLFNQTFILYMGILTLCIIGLLFLNLISIQSSFFKLLQLHTYLHIIPFVLCIFFAQIFQYVSVPYYIVKDKFRNLSIIGLITNVISIFLIFTHHLYEHLVSLEILYVIILCYIIRSLPVYIYRKK